MIKTLETIFPREASNDYRGSRIALYGFLPVVAIQTFSACVHYFTYDSGKVQIAGMIPFDGTPDPSGLIFALGANAGAWELIILAIYGVVLWRYRNLIPLMFALAIAKSLLGFGNTCLHPIDPAYFEHTPPALIVRLPRLGFELLMLLLAVRQPAKSPAPAVVIPDHGD